MPPAASSSGRVWAAMRGPRNQCMPQRREVAAPPDVTLRAPAQAAGSRVTRPPSSTSSPTLRVQDPADVLQERDAALPRGHHARHLRARGGPPRRTPPRGEASLPPAGHLRVEHQRGLRQRVIGPAALNGQSGKNNSNTKASSFDAPRRRRRLGDEARGLRRKDGPEPRGHARVTPRRGQGRPPRGACARGVAPLLGGPRHRRCARSRTTKRGCRSLGGEGASPDSGRGGQWSWGGRGGVLLDDS